MINSLMSVKNIWIYGAGFIGTKVAEMLIKRGVIIAGFVTSSERKSFVPNLNIKTYVIDDILTYDEDSLFIIATEEKRRSDRLDIENVLIKKGFSNIVFWKDIDIENYWLGHNYHFIARKRDLKKVCFVLAGYKVFLWKDVFSRLERFVPKDVEVCILSSGKYDDELNRIAEKNNWSYLYTDYNSVTYIQNVAISLYNKAEFIFKMDEDMFLTENCFEKLQSTYNDVTEKEPYNIGFVAPLIPINGYGHIRILDILDKRKEYEERFDKVLYGCQPNQKLESSIEAAKYMWGAGEYIPMLDDLNNIISSKKLGYSFCNVRFSIGFILFHRDLWKDMWGFSVSGNPDMGIDEEELCMHCMKQSYAIAVSEESVVGHFSFGPQTEEMKEFYLSNRDFFVANNT